MSSTGTFFSGWPYTVKLVIYMQGEFTLHPKQKEINRINTCYILVNLLQYPVDRVLLGIIVQLSILQTSSTHIAFSIF